MNSYLIPTNNYYVPAPHRYERMTNNSPLETRITDDPLAMLTANSLELTRAKVDMFTTLLDQRTTIYRGNMDSLQKDELFTKTAIREFEQTGQYDTARNVGLNQLLQIERERRQEHNAHFKDTLFLNKYLIESVLEYKNTIQRGDFLNSMN